MHYENLLLTLSIAVAAVFGDYIVFSSKYSSSQVFRAVSDILVHASIGFLSSVAFFSYDIHISDQALVLNVAVCTLVSSLIDIDHVFAARSILWKDLITARQRGIFHCTTFWLLVTTALLTYSWLYKRLNVHILTWMFVIAYTSHHIRDANRRGLWLFPFGHTPPFSKILYVILLAILPYFFSILFRGIKPFTVKHSIVDYTIV